MAKRLRKGREVVPATEELLLSAAAVIDSALVQSVGMVPVESVKRLARAAIDILLPRQERG